MIQIHVVKHFDIFELKLVSLNSRIVLGTYVWKCKQINHYCPLKPVNNALLIYIVCVMIVMISKNVLAICSLPKMWPHKTGKYYFDICHTVLYSTNLSVHTILSNPACRVQRGRRERVIARGREGESEWRLTDSFSLIYEKVTMQQLRLNMLLP